MRLGKGTTSRAATPRRVRRLRCNAEALGRMLQQGRMLHGMRQRQLADQLGIGQKWVWEMEQGKPGLLTERLFDMLRATGVRLTQKSTIRRNHQGLQRNALAMGELRVELYGHLVGWLSGTNWRSFDFRTDRSFVEHFEFGSTISVRICSTGPGSKPRTSVPPS